MVSAGNSDGGYSGERTAQAQGNTHGKSKFYGGLGRQRGG
jgi:hypothetical protein